MKKRTAWILAAAVAAVAVGASAVGALVLVWRGAGGLSGAQWSSRSYLDLALRGELPEQPPPDLGLPFERRAPTLRTYVDSLDRAASDASVKAAVLRIGHLPGAGWGKVQELRDALSRFRKAGKPAYAYLETAGNKEYYLATACDKIYAVPTALLDVSGLATEVTFFARTLDKLGVQAQFEGIGKYKNAPNQYTESGLTPPHREQMEALLDSFYGQYLQALAKGRGKTPAQMQAIVDAGPYDGREALRAGLVDELLYRDELEERLEGATRLTPGRYVSGSGGFHFGRPRIALVYAVGEIVSGASQQGAFGGEFAGSDTVAGAIRQARTDSTVRALVLRVDSPGGSGTASDVIWREVKETARVKPVVVSMGDLAASGGYYVAMAGDVIVAQPGTITGSIGVFGGKFSLRGLYDKIGLSKEILTRGRNAALFTEYRPWSDEERLKVRGLMAAFYRDFVHKVAEHRGKSEDEIDAVAQGRVWSGVEALERGLVDKLGGLDVAFDEARQRAKIARGQDLAVIVLPERKSFFEQLMERDDEDARVTRLLPLDVRALLNWASVATEGPLARLPFEVRVR